MKSVRGIKATITLIILVLISSCVPEDSTLLESIVRLSPARYRDEIPSEEQIEIWKRDVARYDAVVREKIEAADRASSLHKLLAEEYSRLEMFSLALESYEQVLLYEPSNHVVLYSAGVAAAQTALSRPTEAESLEYINRAAKYHERAIEIDPGYPDPYLALSILYFFELGQTEQAKELLTRGIDLFPAESVRMLFVLAQIAVTEDRLEDAVDLYDRISRQSRNSDERNAAIANREAILGGQ